MQAGRIAAPSLIKVGSRTVYRHVVSNFDDVLPLFRRYDWTLALGEHLHIREMIRFESPTATRFYQTAAASGPPRVRCRRFRG